MVQIGDVCYRVSISSGTADALQPGYERGWADTKAAKEAGMNVDDNYEAFAKKRQPECKVDEKDWEWVHGHIRGQKDCLKSGREE